MRKIAIIISTILVGIGVSSLAFGADASVTSAALGTVSSISLAAGLGIGIGVLGPGIGQGFAISGTCTGIARNPEAAGTLRVTMIIGLALIESLAIYALVVALLLLYAHPYSSLVTSFLG